MCKVKCKKCGKIIEINPDEEPEYVNEAYFYKEYVYPNNELLHHNCLKEKILDALK